MAARDIEAAGGLSYAAALFAHGYEYSDVRRHLQDRFRGETYASLHKVVDDAQQAGNVGAQLGPENPDYALPAGQVPGKYPGRNNFRYYAYVNFRNTATGDVVTRVAITTSEASLSYNQLEASIRSQAGNEPAPVVLQSRTNTVPGEYVFESIEVYSVERW